MEPENGDNAEEGGRRKKGRETDKNERGGAKKNTTPVHPHPPQTPEIGFILNQNKSLSHKSQQLRLNLSRNGDEIYCGRWEKRRIISGEALASR